MHNMYVNMTTDPLYLLNMFPKIFCIRAIAGENTEQISLASTRVVNLGTTTKLC